MNVNGYVLRFDFEESSIRSLNVTLSDNVVAVLRSKAVYVVMFIYDWRFL